MKTIALLFIIVFPSYSQINQQFKGDRIELDTAIVMPVGVYREIRYKVITADSAILYLENQILSQNQLIGLLQKETRNLISQATLQNNYIEQSKMQLSEIQRGIKEIKELPKTKLPFYKRDGFLIGAAILATYLAAR